MNSMEAIWNRVELERPPNATCYVSREKFDATAFLATIEKVTRDLNSQELLHKEAAVLSRLVYRMKSKFRNDKGVKAMSKVNKTLLKYLSLSLEKEYENLKAYVETEGNYIKLPTKQMVEYVLIKTQGFAKLMSRVEEVSKHSAHFLKSRIAIGHAWGTSLIAYAVVSRIWILSRHLIKRSCIWYNDLYQYLKFFKISGLNWLPSGYELPSNLEVWLALSWIHEPTPSVPSSHGLKNTMFKLIIPREPDSDEELVLGVHDDYNEETKAESVLPFAQKENIYNLMPKNENKGITFEDDAGELIHRDSFNLEHRKKRGNVFIDDHCEDVQVVAEKVVKVRKIKGEELSEDTESKNVGISQDKSFMPETQNLPKNKNLQELLTFDNVKNKEGFMVLLNKESYPGLDKLQWNMIRKKSKKLLNKLDTCQDETEQLVLLKKLVKRVQCWIT